MSRELQEPSPAARAAAPASPVCVLVVDDDSAARYGMRRVLAGEGYRIAEADSGERCLDMLEVENPAVILLDVSMPGLGGVGCLEEIVRREAHGEVVMVTAYGNERLAVECLKKGAYDYLPKPYEIEELKAIVARAAERVSLRLENRRLRSELERRQSGVALGVSGSMRRIEKLIERIAPANVTVLLVGESGTGKELVAREVHRRSQRSGGPFVALNCAALPEELVESELFGHERGAFTGAVDTRKGKFELADKGTLFLDEVGEMSPRTQSKLLRVLQERCFERVGGTRTVAVDVRVVAATNKDLPLEVSRGAFREDLYYRLKVAEIRLPPLRERREDIAVLARQFLRTCSPAGQDATIAAEALEMLLAAPWPGNVRELKNAIEYAVVMSDAGTITAESLPGDLRARARETVSLKPPQDESPSVPALPYGEARRKAIESFERSYIEARLRDARGNVSEAARLMGIARQSLQSKIRELGVEPARFRLREPGEAEGGG